MGRKEKSGKSLGGSLMPSFDAEILRAGKSCSTIAGFVQCEPMMKVFETWSQKKSRIQSS